MHSINEFQQRDNLAETTPGFASGSYKLSCSFCLLALHAGQFPHRLANCSQYPEIGSHHAGAFSLFPSPLPSGRFLLPGSQAGTDLRLPLRCWHVAVTGDVPPPLSGPSSCANAEQRAGRCLLPQHRVPQQDPLPIPFCVTGDGQQPAGPGATDLYNGTLDHCFLDPVRLWTVRILLERQYYPLLGLLLLLLIVWSSDKDCFVFFKNVDLIKNKNNPPPPSPNSAAMV